MFRLATPARWAIVLVMVIAIGGSLRYRLLGDHGQAWKYAINNDGKGYYEHLRVLLVDGDFRSEHGESWMFAPAGDGKAIKFFVGTALIQAPYVLAAHAYTLLFSNGPQDGYSLQYHLAIVLSALVSLLLGLWFTRGLLLGMGVGEFATAFMLVAITLGTGLLVQTVVHPGMSHVHSFAAVAGFLLAARRAWSLGGAWRWMLVGGLLGLVIILRPVDMLLLLGLPLATMGIAPPAHKTRWNDLACFAIAFGAVLLVQGAAWYVQCGEWIVRPYSNEGFHWDRPAFLQHLFSARNGLLFYWPVLLVLVPGLWTLAQRTPYRAAIFVMFLALFGYVTSAWWNWSYGDSFGQRPYVDILALFAIPMAFAIDPKRGRWQRWIVYACIPLILLNVFQSWQYATHVLDPARMDLSKYAYVFLRTDPARGAALGGIQDLPPYAPQGMFPVLDTNATWQPDSSGTMHWIVPPARAGSGLWYVELDITRTEFEPGATQRIEALVDGSSTGWPGEGVRFKVEHLPVANPGTKGWNNTLRMPPQTAGDTIALHLDVPNGCRMDAAFLRVMAPN
ncbi:MAG: hypothetical protein IPI41_01430 [Flavobacteriales bacterium]|nr:hypothetical protein [Flavobacteriales bacterium]